jgi:hypothetical protein
LRRNPAGLRRILLRVSGALPVLEEFMLRLFSLLGVALLLSGCMVYPNGAVGPAPVAVAPVVVAPAYAYRPYPVWGWGGYGYRRW